LDLWFHWCNCFQTRNKKSIAILQAWK